MSVKIQFAALSAGASVDQQTGRLSVFDVVEELKVPDLPLRVPNLVISLIAGKTTSKEIKGSMKVLLKDPSGRVRELGTNPIGFPENRKRLKAVFRFSGFPVEEAGVHILTVDYQGAAGKSLAKTEIEFSVLHVAGEFDRPSRGENPGSPSMKH